MFVTHEAQGTLCTVVQHFHLSFALNVLDSVLVFGAPSILLTILNLAIVWRLLKDRRHAQKDLGSSHKNGDSQTRKITILLIAVPCVFVLLNLPNYVIRCRNYVMVAIGAPPPTVTDMISNQIAGMLYFTSYAIDFYLYAFSSSHFRGATLSMLKRRVLGAKENTLFTLLSRSSLSKGNKKSENPAQLLDVKKRTPRHCQSLLTTPENLELLCRNA